MVAANKLLHLLEVIVHNYFFFNDQFNHMKGTGNV